MDCYHIVYRHNAGTHTASKWGESANDALALVKQYHKRVGLAAAVGAIHYEKPVLVVPQPFERRATNPILVPKYETAETTAVEVDFSLAADVGDVTADAEMEELTDPGVRDEAA